MAAGHTDERIRKLAQQGLSLERIAQRIGRPGDVARVRRALKLPEPAPATEVKK